MPVNSWKDLFDIAQRRRTALLAPLLGLLTLAVTAAFLWPDRYQSSATIRVVPPAISERMLPPATPGRMAERIAGMQQAILSRANLTALIQNLDLYRDLRAHGPMEDAVEHMRRDVTVTPLAAPGEGRPSTFRVAFTYPDRYAAQRVTAALTTRFIDANLRSQTQETSSVVQFLREQMDRAQLELDQLEERATVFRTTRGTLLGEGAALYLHQSAQAEARAAALESAIARGQGELARLEAEAAQPRPADPAPAAPRPAAPDNSPLQAAEVALEALRSRYTPRHPDVLRLEAQVAALRARSNQPRVAAAAPTPRPVPPPAGDAATARVRLQRESLDRDRQELASVRQRLAAIEARAGARPAAQAQWEELNRALDPARRRQEDARRRLQEAEQAQQGAQRQLAETLELVDGASLPESPEAPHRGAIAACGLLLGLIAGAAMATLLESGDDAFHSLRQLRATVREMAGGLAVLGGLSLIEDEAVLRRRRRWTAVSWAAALLLSAASMAGSAIYYFSHRV